MKPSKEAIEAYKEMAKASPASMKTMIEENLKATCDKYAGHEDRLDDCIDYLTECAKQILGSKNGEVDNETCYRICRDYFNDELWAKEDESKKAEQSKKKAKEPKKKAEKPVKKTAAQVEKETVAKERERIEKIKEKHSAKAEKKAETCKRCGLEVIDLKDGLCPACCSLENPEKTPEQLIAEKNRAIVEENNRKMGISMAKPIDMFAEAV